MAKARTQKAMEGDPLVPILNLVCMLIPLMLYGAVYVRFVTLDVQSPKLSAAPTEKPPQDDQALSLTVMITDQGFHFKVNPKFRMPWMSQATETASAGPDVPKKDDAYDYAELERKLKEIKKGHLEEQNIIIGAEDDIAYEILLKTMDWSRGTPDEPLFPVVTLTRGVV